VRVLERKDREMEDKKTRGVKKYTSAKEEEIIPVPALLCVHDGYDAVSAPYLRQRLVKKVYHKRSPISAEMLNHINLIYFNTNYTL
jgi:hypothetical protein